MILKVIFFLSTFLTSLFIVQNFIFERSNLQIKNYQYSYVSAEVYCWCIAKVNIKEKASGKSFYMSYCNTFYAVMPEELINDKNKIAASDDKKVIDNLSRIFNKSIFKEVKNGETIDARFVIVFRKADGSEVIFSSNDESRFYFAHDRVNVYNFNVIDSVKKIMNLDKIECRH